MFKPLSAESMSAFHSCYLISLMPEMYTFLTPLSDLIQFVSDVLSIQEYHQGDILLLWNDQL